MTKGSNNEREAHGLLSRAGYAAYRPATVRFGENDVWGMFDVLAISPDGRPDRRVQVGSNDSKAVGQWFRKAWLFASEDCRVELWRKYDNGGWKADQAAYGPIPESSHGSKHLYRTAVDERKDDRIAGHGHTDMNLGDGVVEWLNNQKRDVGEL